MTFILPLSLLGSFLLLSSCATKPVAKKSNLQKAQWSTKAQIKDLERQTAQGVQIEILAIKNEKLRLEVSAVMGIPVATIVLDRKDFKAAIYTEKKYYQGPLDDNSLQKLLKIPLSARWIYAIAFDESPGKNWDCESITSTEATERRVCRLVKFDYKIEWNHKDNGTKVVRLTTPKTEINWFFPLPNLNFVEKPESFQLSAPEGFQLKSL